MEKQHLDITTEDFNASHCARQELSLLVGYEGLSYLISSHVGDALVLKAWHFDNRAEQFPLAEPAIRRIFSHDPKLSLPFGKKRCAVFNQMATMVPNRLFNPADLPSYFSLLLRPSSQPLSYFFDDLPDADAKLIFALETSTAKLLEHCLPGAKISHSATTLLKTWQPAAPRHAHEAFIHVRNRDIQIAVFDRKILQFYNAFSFTSIEDFLYFALLVYDQLQLNPLQIPLTLSGDLLENSDVHKVLARYFRYLRFVPLPNFYRFPGPIEALPSQIGFDLYAMKLMG